MTARKSSDRATQLRRRALRELARQEPAAYRRLYQELLPRVSSRDQARGQAWTRLRYEFPDRYFELYGIERATGGAGTDVPPGIRSKAWQRATYLISELRPTRYRLRLDELRAEGLSDPAAASMAAAELREAEPDLFTELLAREIRMWLDNEEAGA